METVDPNMAARVWQRVQGGLWEPDMLIPLVGKLRQDGFVYRYLRGRMPAEGALAQLLEQTRGDIACLKGMYRLRTGPRLPAPEGKCRMEESGLLALTGCYRRCLERAAVYEREGKEPEYGSVFLMLSQQERQRGRQILMLLGRWDD